MRRRIALIAAAIVLVGAAYVVLVRDILTPRSAMTAMTGIGAGHSISPERYNKITAAMKAKYGERAETWLNGQGITTTKVDGVVVATDRIDMRFAYAIGLFLVGASQATMSTFPFLINPDHVPQPSDQAALDRAIEHNFDDSVRPELMRFSSDDFTIERCRNFSALDLGMSRLGPLLRLGRATLCTVTWKRSPQASMLVGATIAEGGWWVRIFARPACRTLADVWLRKVSVLDGTRPDYLACVLADRPDSKSDPTSHHIYEVRADGALALIE